MKTIFNKTFLNILLSILVFLLPLQTRYFFDIGLINNNFFEYTSKSIYFVDVIFIGLLILLFIYNLKNKLFILNIKKIIFLISLILLNIGINISLLKSLDISISLYFNIKIFLLSTFIFLLSFFKINFYLFKEIFILSASLQSFYSIYQFITQFIGANKFMGIAEKLSYALGTSVVENIDGRFLRAYGFFPHPNILSLFLLIGLTFTIFKLINLKDKLKIYFYQYLLGIIFLGIILTFSRIGIFLSILVSIIIFIYRIIKSRKLIYDIEIRKDIKNFIIIFIVQIILIFNFRELLFARVNTNNRLNIISNNERISQIISFKKDIKNNFLFGVGSRNYTTYKYNNNDKLNSWNLKPIHNIFLLYFIENGIFGVISFLLFLLIPIFIKSDFEFKLNYFLILSFGLFDHFIITENFGLLLSFLFIGIIYSKNLSTARQAINDIV